MLYCPSCMGENEDRALRCRHCGGDMSRQNQPHQLPVMTILRGRYLVGRVLGQGGFGITYVGLDLVLGMKVAIKEYYPQSIVSRTSGTTLEVSVDPIKVADTGLDKQQIDAMMDRGRQRFHGEAQTMARLKSEPHIVNVTDFFDDNATAYIVMEYIEGRSLSGWLESHGPEKDFNKVYQMLVPVMEALKKIHEAGMIHRDISPANIMLGEDGELRLIDFGTARDASPEGKKTLTVELKHGYAPMEQYSTHGQQGPWTDVYALCATMYKLTTGVDTLPIATDRVMDDGLVPPSQLGVKIAPAQERALLKGLEVLPKDRIQTMDELMDAFDRGEPSHRESCPTKHKKKKLMPIAAVVALAEGAFTLFGARQGEDSSAPQEDSAAVPIVKIMCGVFHTVGLRSDGTVVAAGMNYAGQCNVSDWRDIVDVDAGEYYTVGLRSNGTVVTTKKLYTRMPAKWTDIVAISGGLDHMVGLRSDGTVVAAGLNYHGECDISDWTDIVAVSAAWGYTVGLRADGTVVATGRNKYGQCDVGGWTDVVAVIAGDDHTVGLRSDGTVLAAGYNNYGQCDVSDWTDIVDLAVGAFSTVGLRYDGTVITTYETDLDKISTWTDIVSIAAGTAHTVGLRSDGTVVAEGGYVHSSCDVSDWKDVIAISVGDSRTIGLRSDGTVLAAGDNDKGQCDVSRW